jgi:hypothetical protein
LPSTSVTRKREYEIGEIGETNETESAHGVGERIKPRVKAKPEPWVWS